MATVIAERHAQDQYMTPPWVVELALDHIPLLDTGRPFLEPCAGTGNFVSALRRRYPDRGIEAVDIDAQFLPGLKQWTPVAHMADFCEWARDYRKTFTNPKIGPDVIVTNPPFSLAREILDAAFLVARPDTQIVMLLRLGFLESRKRRGWWQEHPLDHLYVLSQRPSFTGGGTDATAYGYFVWRAGSAKGVTVL